VTDRHVDPAALIAEARTHLGGPPGPLRVGRDPINLPMVHHWCQALDDQNQAYLDEGFAANTRGHLIAPPGMLQTWTMDAPRGADVTASNDHVNRLLDEAGYTSVVAVNYEHEYVRELQHGERISVRSAAEDLSEEKQTALGAGYFTTVRHEYVTDDGEVIGIGRMRLLKFKPPAGEASSAAPEVGARPTPAIGRDNQFFWDGVQAGELRIGTCNRCKTLHHPPQPICRSCGSTDMGFTVSSGRGVVYSHVTHHYPKLQGVELPHTVLLVELEEGVRVVSEWSAAARPATTYIGQQVRVAFTEVPGGELRPTFQAVP
jgi:uncharacterized OB-fold protein